MQSILRAFYINELTAYYVLLDRIEICNIRDNVFVTEEMKTRCDERSFAIAINRARTAVFFGYKILKQMRKKHLQRI